MREVRVAAGQAIATWGDVAANVATAVRLVELAGSQDVRLLVLPEAFLVGYDEEVFAAGGFPTEADLGGAWLAPLRAAVAAAGLSLLVAHPLARAHGDVLSLLVLTPDGRCAAPYDKQHVDADERAWFTPGAPPAVLALAGLAVGPAICADTGVEEHAASLAAAGAEAYVASTAWFAGSEQRRDELLVARAVTHGIHVVAAGAIGPSRGRRGTRELVGGSVVVAPDGTVLARLGTEPGLAVADVQVEDVEDDVAGEGGLLSRGRERPRGDVTEG